MKRLAALILLLLVGTAQAGGVYTNTGAGGVPVDGTVTPAKMSDYYTTVTDDGDTGARDLIDFSASAIHKSAVTADTQYYFTPPSTSGQVVQLLITNSGAGWTRAFLPSPEVSTVTTVADVAGSLDGTYFLIYDTGGSVCVWFDVDDNGTVEPGGACSAATRDLEVTTVVTGDSAALVATATKLKLDADAQYVATVVSSTVTVVDVVSEARTDLTAGTSGFTVAVAYQGDSTTMTWVGGTEPTWVTTAGVLNLVRCVWDGTNYKACENTVGGGGGGGAFSGAAIITGANPSTILPTSSLTLLNLNGGGEGYDTDNYFDAASNDYFEVPTTGYYQISWHVIWDSPAVTRCDSRLYLNGSDCDGTILDAQVTSCQFTGNFYRPGTVTITNYLTAGDRLSLCGFHDRGSNMTVYIQRFEVVRKP